MKLLKSLSPAEGFIVRQSVEANLNPPLILFSQKSCINTLEARRKSCQSPACASKKKSKQQKELMAVALLLENFPFILLKFNDLQLENQGNLSYSLLF